MGPVAGQKRKFSSVIDQALDAEFDSWEEAQTRNLLGGFDQMNGGLPARAEEPSGDQLKALSEILAADRAPYTDFAIWGPYGRRQAKLLKFVQSRLTGRGF